MVWTLDDEPDHPGRIEDANQLVNTPEVERVIIRNMRTKRLLELSAPTIIVKNELQLLWDEDVASGRRVVS